MRKMVLQVLFVLVFIQAAGLFTSCNKGEQFLEDTDFETSVQVTAFTTQQQASVDIAIDDSTWNDISITSPGALQDIFSKAYALPASGKSHVVIRWNDTMLVVDTVIQLKSINKYYLIQFNAREKPQFRTSFGEANTPEPDSGFVKARFFFSRDAADSLSPFPDTIKLKFIKIVQSSTGVVKTPDTSITLTDGEISGYLQVPDCKGLPGGTNIYLGYQIINPVNGAVLQDYCFGNFKVGVIQINSAVGKSKQTLSFKYKEVQGCNFGNLDNIYEMELLIRGN